MECKQYKDNEGNSVKVGDKVEKVGICDLYIPLGVVLSMRKEGFYVWVKTEKYPNQEIWGKFTRKIN
jgi:hypothetical protein